MGVDEGDESASPPVAEKVVADVIMGEGGAGPGGRGRRDEVGGG